MLGTKRSLTAALVAAALLVLPGCIKMRWIVTVYPDDSGKLELTMGMGGALSGLSEMGGEAGGEVSGGFADPDDISEDSGGFVAWSEPQQVTEGDFKLTKITGYFEDINKVTLDMEKDEEGKEKSKPTSYTFKKNDDGTFEASFVDNSMTDDLEEQGGELGGAQSEQEKEMAKAMMKGMMAGFEISFGFVMPGEVTEAEQMDVDGRKATLKLDIDKLFDMDQEKAKDGLSGVVKSGPAVDGIEEEMAAFKKELEEAKVAWKKRLEKAKAGKAADKPADKPGATEGGEKKDAGDGEGAGAEKEGAKDYAPAPIR